MRLFIAISLFPEQRDVIAHTQQQLRAQIHSHSVKWVAPENVHLTLQFLGEVEARLVPQLEAALKAACAKNAPLVLEIAGAGCFPDARRPRVLWLGFQGDLGALNHLQRGIARGVAPFLREHDNKPFFPHLTLGRVKTFDREEARRIGHALQNIAVPNSSAWRVESVELIQSELTPAGPVYTTRAKIDL